ncbi:hypothetical protein FA95DRAFT_1608292 [Auriscalpium vulgare]|uniref:Uncharacterized protein n=1 Tax=Auriscalpium vulgare TaxID=40419 RepID=A0ACB8RKQ2_9AGAM|nr:hypothetical protein FA95DRAFT_1608292 [Auriscalpium vulgare]
MDMQAAHQAAAVPAPNLFLNGYLAHTFTPHGAAFYLAYLLKVDAATLYPIGNVHGWPRAVFIAFPQVPNAAPHALAGAQQPLWITDYEVAPNLGTVIPQRLWYPHSVTDQRQYVAQARLELPVFFVHANGALGLTLANAAAGNFHTLRGSQAAAPIGGKSSTHLRIAWPGYKDYKRQFQTRDETFERKPITLEKFVRHVARSVDAFLQHCEVDVAVEAPRWRIGENGITRNDIYVMGAVHVSAGSWMPILQLARG